VKSSDGFAIRVVVVTLAVATIFGMGLTGYLAVHDSAIPDQLDRLITLMAGGLLGILSRTSSGATETQPVKVVNKDHERVPVDETPQPPPNVDPANPRH
jgi:hypothetical protein